jgi:sigma-B regulation protein RsbU (phosphoserine phosphatase)
MTTGKAKILVVDDEPGMLRAVERILAPEHAVTTVASPTEALEIAGSMHPDLVICDISMPKMDGFDVMSRLKEARRDVDVIMMTGLSEPDAQLVRAIREKAFYFIQKPFNRDVMRTLVERCLELRRLRLSEHKHTKRMERELAEARTFQQSMLPPTRANIEGVEIAARYVACSELCGDIFDYAPAGDGRAAVLIADVSGHGTSAALLTAVVKSAFRSAAVDDYEPRAVVSRVLDGIRTFSDRRFVTLIAARIDPGRGGVELVNGGHPPMVVRRSGSGELMMCGSTGPMISPAFVGETWEQTSIPISAGDDLLMYTDGITDVAGESGLFSQQRVIEAFRDCKDGGEKLIDAILGAAHHFAGGRPPGDDLTLLTARFSS